MRSAIDEFHKFYEKHRLWQNTKWLGVPCWKLPFDAFVIHDIICELRPDWIVETGTSYGGSSLFYASICELIDNGSVITIDIEPKNNMVIPQCRSSILDRIQYIKGNSIDKEVVKRVEKTINGSLTTIVILDSWHSYEHVSQELQLYSRFVTEGSYLIVEDTHVSGHPVEWEWGKGPFEAVQDFLKNNVEFEVDYSREFYLMSFNPGGFLKKRRK